MNPRTISKLVLSGGVALVLAANALPATISLDENGTGTIDGTALSYTATGSNPMPPFQSPVLTYTLPFSGVAGIVELMTPGSAPPVPEDEIQFTGNSTAIFYSQVPGNDLADKYSPQIFPFPQANTIQIQQTSPGVFAYTPSSGQPGYDTSAPTYDFVAAAVTSTVPEPSNAGMTLLGLAGIALILQQSLRKPRRS